MWEYHRKFNPSEAEDIVPAAAARASWACVPWTSRHLATVLIEYAGADPRAKPGALARADPTDSVRERDRRRPGPARARGRAGRRWSACATRWGFGFVGGGDVMKRREAPGRGGAVAGDLEQAGEALRGRARALRGAARPAAPPHQARRDRHHDIPIARITEQYLGYLELMRTLDLEVAGEYLVMAATLMRIKPRCCCRCPRGRGGGRGRSARGAGPPADRVPPLQGRRPSCSTSARRCARRSGSGPTAASRRLPARNTSPSWRSTSSACIAAFKAVARAREGRGRRSRCPPSRSRSRPASSSCSRGSRKPRRAASRTSSRTCRRRAT